MIIFNKKGSVYFEINSGITSGDFLIYALDACGNRIIEETVSGKLETVVYSGGPRTSFEVFSIPDGEYEVVVTGGDGTEEAQKFSVFYNLLNFILEDMKFLFCSDNCTDCSEVDLEKEYLKTMANLSLFLNRSTLLEELPRLKYLSKRISKILIENLLQKRYYGKFNFSYKQELHTFFVYFYSELYSYQKNKLKDLNLDILLIDEVFFYPEVRRCLSTTSLTLESASKFLSDLNINCDGE